MSRRATRGASYRRPCCSAWRPEVERVSEPPDQSRSPLPGPFAQPRRMGAGRNRAGSCDCRATASARRQRTGRHRRASGRRRAPRALRTSAVPARAQGLCARYRASDCCRSIVWPTPPAMRRAPTLRVCAPPSPPCVRTSVFRPRRRRCNPHASPPNSPSPGSLGASELRWRPFHWPSAVSTALE